MGAIDNPIVWLAAASAVALVLFLATHVCLNSLLGDSTAILIGCFLVVFVLDSIFRVREYSDKSVDIQIIIKVISWCYIFLFAVLRIPKYLARLTSAPRILWFIFLAWALYTTSYSPNPAYGAIAVFSVAAFFLYFMSLEAEHDSVAVVIAVATAISTIAFVSIIAYFAVPQLGRMSEWQNGTYAIGRRLSGIVGTPNAAGAITSFGLVLLGIKWQEIKQRLGSLFPSLLCAICGAALIMSYSRTSIFSVVAILGANRLLHTRYLPWVVVLALAGLVGVLLLVPYSEQAMVMLSRSGEAAEIETGTARTQIWDTVIKLADMKFWYGWGYASSVFVLPSYSAYMGQTPPHAHNIVLQLWLTVGMIGLILFVVAFLAQVLYAVLRRDTLAVSLLGFVLINGSTEPGALAGIANMATVALSMAIAGEYRQSFAARLRYPIRTAAS